MDSINQDNFVREHLNTTILDRSERAYCSCNCVRIESIQFTTFRYQLIIDFDFIERGAQRMLPKDYEWYGAFGLMVTLVWLYLEILRLLAKMKERS